MTSVAKVKAEKPKLFRHLINLFPRALIEVSKVSAMGEYKHGYKSFMNDEYPAEGFIDANVRHVFGLALGGEINIEDGNVYHKAQQAWSALASLEKILIAKENE